MARISEKNIRFRTKEEICRDVAFVLRTSKLHKGTKYAVVDQALWVWTEFDGKYKGCKYWSEKAVAAGSGRRRLIHEHLVPRKLVRDKLFRLRKPTQAAVHRILRKWCVGVVVTQAEDRRLKQRRLNSKMPQKWNRRDRWARYKAAGIDIAA